MQVQEIKQALSINQVLEHYNLKPDKNNRLLCPFHEDHSPSLQVYPETNTYTCFSSKCSAGSGDVIDFIMHRENTNKHLAILKAKRMINGTVKALNASEKDLSRIALLTKVFSYFRQAAKSRSAQLREYAEKRKIDVVKQEVGYNSGQFHHRENKYLVESCLKHGLLIPYPNGNHIVFARHCLIFPLKNDQNQIVSFYGRSVMDDAKAKHFYLKDRQGLYPGYPEKETQTLILTESVIDAQSLIEHKETLRITDQALSILALYGTNGLTPEHLQAIKNLEQLHEIILFFDGDEPGDLAAEKHSMTLHQLLPDIRISKVQTPKGEDINSLLQGHEPEIYNHLLKERAFLFSIEKENPRISRDINESSHEPGGTLNTSNKDKIIYESQVLKIEIWGGIEYSNLHRLRLSLYLENPDTGLSFRDDVNLYSSRNRKAFIQDASEELEIPVSELKQIINDFTRQIEQYRLKQKANFSGKNRPESVKLSTHQQKQALAILKDKDLVNHLKTAMKKVGLVGETENGLLLFLIFLTRHFDNPLHALVHGSTGSGKTNLLKSILMLVPGESKYETTALTENVLFRPPYKDFWKHKILLIEDLDGSYKALLPLREFMTNQYISKFAADPNPKTGKYEQVKLEAHGPVVIAGATTKDRIYEDNSNRSYLLHVNETKAHQMQIMDYQNRDAAGLIDKSDADSVCEAIHNVQRMMDPRIKVINPFQPELKLPEYVFRKLRTNTHYITLIKAVTFLFQHQREVKSRSTAAGVERYIETTLEDVELANRLSKQSLLRKSDELSGHLRDFFECLKETARQSGKENFLAKDIRSIMRMHPMKFSRYINELRSRGYVKKVGGKERGSFEYQVTTWDDYQILQKGLEIMDKILARLNKQYPGGIYKKDANMMQQEEITVIS